MIRKHAAAAVVAAAILAAALFEGAFDPAAYAASSVVIWAAVIAGLTSRALPTTPATRLAGAAGLCLAGVMVLAAASVGWSGDQGRAFDEAVRVSAYLGLFVLAACSASRPGRARWLGGMTAGLAAVTVLSLLSHLQPGLLGDSELDSLIPGAAGRLSYPIGYWNGLAALLALASVLLAHAAANAPGRALRSAATAVVPLALLAIWLTESRGGTIAVVVGLSALIAAADQRWRQLVPIAIGASSGAILIGVAELMGGLGGGAAEAARRSDGDLMSALAPAVAAAAGAAAWLLDGRAPRLRPSRGAALAAAGVAALLLVVALAAADPAERFREFKAEPSGLSSAEPQPIGDDLNGSGRWQFWGEALDGFESAPVAGLGAGAYEDWWAQNATIPVFVRNPHSLPLQQAAELGLIGVALLLGFVAAVALAARRRLTAGRQGDAGVLIAVLATAAIGAVIDWTWAIPAAFAPAVIAAALLTASAPGRPLRRDGYWLAIGAVALAWVAMVAGGLVVLTEAKLEASRSAASEGRITDAVERAREARTVQPWSPEPYTQLALLEESRGDLDEALVRLRQAQARDSEDWRLALIEARLQVGRGDEIAAAEAVERARVLNPLVPVSDGQS